jgi:hypothetical protein
MLMFSFDFSSHHAALLTTPLNVTQPITYSFSTTAGPPSRPQHAGLAVLRAVRNTTTPKHKLVAYLVCLLLAEGRAGVAAVVAHRLSACRSSKGQDSMAYSCCGVTIGIPLLHSSSGDAGHCFRPSLNRFPGPWVGKSIGPGS